jgi:hypothetical protein
MTALSSQHRKMIDTLFSAARNSGYLANRTTTSYACRKLDRVMVGLTVSLLPTGEGVPV